MQNLKQLADKNIAISYLEHLKTYMPSLALALTSNAGKSHPVTFFGDKAI
jgi:hypothetical protein